MICPLIFLTNNQRRDHSRRSSFNRKQDNQKNGATETTGPLPTISGRGITSYELSNHLGNVLTILDNVKYAWDIDNDDLFDQYVLRPKGSADYYPLGLEMAGFISNAEIHRFGFNGKEKDPSMSETLTYYDYLFRHL